MSVGTVAFPDIIRTFCLD